MGNKMLIRKNDVQRMTAGTGLYHSEQNISDHPVHFYQIWIHPNKKSLTPSYDQKTYSPDLWKNKLALLASDKTDKGLVTLNTDASLYRAELDKGKDVGLKVGKKRKPFLYVINGTIEINGKRLDKTDQARISEEMSLHVTAIDHAELILIDVPA
jgi:hypothetical protein